jgi:hypothetical protein
MNRNTPSLRAGRTPPIAAKSSLHFTFQYVEAAPSTNDELSCMLNLPAPVPTKLAKIRPSAAVRNGHVAQPDIREKPSHMTGAEGRSWEGRRCRAQQCQ